MPQAAYAGSRSPIEVVGNDIALSQPVVNLQVLDPVTGESLGPVHSQPFLLDTGASGVFIAGGSFPNFDTLALTNAFTELSDAGVNFAAGTIEELGIGGVQVVEFSDPYDLVATRDGSNTVELEDVRMLANGDASFGGFAGILGMPAMVNRVTSLDQTVWSGGLGDLDLDTGTFDNLYMDVQFGAVGDATLPDAEADQLRFTAPLHLKSFAYEGNPTIAPNNEAVPFANISVSNGNTTIITEALVDTGAQLGVISSDLAVGLGLGTKQLVDDDGDANTPMIEIFVPFDTSGGTLEVSGVNGIQEAPLVGYERLSILGEDDTELAFNGIGMIVLDIDPEIPLIIGSDFITTGWLEALIGTLGLGEPGPDGLIDRVHFDFTESHNLEGQMILDLNTNAIPEPSSLLLIAFAGSAVLSRRRR
jgi:hypothetical protein